ncbi:MAG TPA: heme biosynthesis HemY N-terminal domain-containing protein [Gammaproteobacteria bacterium]|nr:heme biosynthesis HemY N-terminal domain-containing protein [Gammaproteobacteria bacterium]
MRFGLWALLALLLGAFAAHFLLADHGYVLINFRGYVVEMSVPGLVLVLTALYLAIRGGVAVVRAPRWFRGARAEQRMRRSGAELTRGVIHLIEGDWMRGERLLTQSLKGSDAPLVSYLLAARAAQLQGAKDRRDEWLKLAAQESPAAETATLLTLAELQLDGGELDTALATAERLVAQKPDHPAVLALLARVYRARNDTPQLAALLPRLGLARLPPAARDALALEVLEAELAAPALTPQRLAEIWSSLASELKQSPALLARRALALDRLGLGDEAERELRAALKRNWNAALVAAYGEVRGAEPPKQLQYAEGWLKNYPEDPTLLGSAARLCMANELWGKARSYLETSLALAPTPETYALYGRLLAQLGEGEGAALAYRSGLALVSPAAREAASPAPRRLGPPVAEKK